MAIKRKSGKRRSNQSRLVSGILIGLVVVIGLGGVGFVGHMVYNKVILPALAEQKAKRIREEFAAAEGRPAVPTGWRLYSQGQFQMIVPDMPSASLPSPERGQFQLFEASADGLDIYIARQTTLPIPGRSNLYDYFTFGGPSGPLQVTRERKLDGPPRGQEAYFSRDGKTSYSRVYEESPTSLLIIDIVGDTNSARHQEVVRSISCRPPAALTTPAAPASTTGSPINSKSLDILALINTQQHRIAGDWSRKGSEVMSPVMVAAMLELPFQATPSYEMELEVERVGTKVESFCIAFPIDGNWGMVVLDGYDGVASGLNLVNGQKAFTNPDRYQSPVFRSGKNQIKLRVTPKTIVVEVNGTTIVNWAGDPTTLSIEYYWKAGEGKAFIGTWNAEYIVSRIDVRGL